MVFLLFINIHEQCLFTAEAQTIYTESVEACPTEGYNVPPADEHLCQHLRCQAPQQAVQENS